LLTAVLGIFRRGQVSFWAPPARNRLLTRGCLIYVTLCSVALFVEAGSVWSYRLTAEFVRTADESRRDATSVRAAIALAAAVRAAESGQRGYLLSNREEYLNPYNRAVGEIPALVRAIRSRRVWDQNALEGLLRDVHEKMKELDQTVSLARGGKRRDARRVFETDKGRKLMVRIQEESDRMVRAADQAASRRDAANATSGRAAMTINPVIFGLAPVVVATAMFAWYRSSLDVNRSRAEAAAAHSSVERNNRTLAAISHDIRAPLHAVSMQAGFIRFQAARDVLDAAEVLEATDKIMATLADLKAMLDGFLDVVRASAEPAEVEVFRCADVLKAAASVLEPAAAPRAVRVVTSAFRDPVLSNDRKAMLRVLQNLIENAVKFSPAGGTVRCDARPVNGGVEFLVSDEGPGIPEDVFPKLFHAFVQGGNPERDPRKGFGLGLAIVARLCERMKATVAVSSHPGSGAVFTVRVPDLPAAGP
jgi:signal transduction histidine kinase